MLLVRTVSASVSISAFDSEKSKVVSDIRFLKKTKAIYNVKKLKTKRRLRVVSHNFDGLTSEIAPRVQL